MNKNWLLVPMVSLSIVGCTKMSPTQMALNSVNGGNIDKSSGVPACEIQPTEYVLDAKMVAFEMTDSGGINVGFNLAGILKLIGVDFSATSGKMTIGMSLIDPMVPNIDLLDVTGDGTSLKFNAAVDVGFQNIGASFDFSHNTPLSTLTASSMTDTFTKLTTQMTALQSSWHTQIVAIPTSNTFIIPVGSYGNIQVGDQFAIYNVNHVWTGTPCASQYVMAQKTTPTPLALAQVVSVNDLQNNGAVLTLVCSEQAPCNHTETVKLGADVEIAKLTDDTRILYRLLQIRNVTGAQIPYDNNKAVDVSPYLKDQINAIAHNFNFMVYAP